jgi:hypothetical protein
VSEAVNFAGFNHLGRDVLNFPARFSILGGETIKQINQQTGAHCEIDRRQQTNMSEKTFIIKGTLDQIEHAKRLFSEKLNMVRR